MTGRPSVDPWGVFWFVGNVAGVLCAVYEHDMTLFIISFPVSVLLAKILWDQAREDWTHRATIGLVKTSSHFKLSAEARTILEEIASSSGINRTSALELIIREAGRRHVVLKQVFPGDTSNIERGSYEDRIVGSNVSSHRKSVRRKDAK